jgi:regulator of protease activity HflC (stomatin/prohibitin superfamily)
MLAQDPSHADRSASSAGKRRFGEFHALFSLSICGIIGFGTFIGLIVLLFSIHTLGPEDQVVVDGPNGKYVRNGPATVVLAPERKKVFRQAFKLTTREYAVVKNLRTGEIRHHPGPSYLFLGAYDVVEEVLPTIVLLRDEYIRLIDQSTGDERVVTGAAAVIPKPLESSPKGVEKAVVIGAETAVVVRLKTTGMLRLETEGGAYFPRPYEEIVEVRKASVIGHPEYAVVKSNLDGSVRHVPGPMLLQVGAYEELLSIEKKMVLRRDEFIRLRSKNDGSERVLHGPSVVIPDPAEHTLQGKQRATFLDVDTAALVLDRTTGQQRLVTATGVFMPSPYEQVLEKRTLIRVLPHEAIVVRNAEGQVSIFGGTGHESFFLKPHWKVLEFTWSDFSDSLSSGGEQNATNVSKTSEQNVAKTKLTKVDMRSQKMFFRYSVQTSDNVQLVVDGTIFWRIVSVAKMLSATSDVPGDVWHHARSALNQAASKATLATFMLSLNQIMAEAFQMQAQDGFYDERGVELEQMEITRFEVLDPATAQILHKIIVESTNRINLLQLQTSTDEVAAARLAADIELEKKRTELVVQQATNVRLQAEMAGDIEGLRRLGFAQTFINGLNESVPNLETRLDLYKHYQRLKSQNEVTHDLGSGGKRFFVTPGDLALNLRTEL